METAKLRDIRCIDNVTYEVTLEDKATGAVKAHHFVVTEGAIVSVSPPQELEAPIPGRSQVHLLCRAVMACYDAKRVDIERLTPLKR